MCFIYIVWIYFDLISCRKCICVCTVHVCLYLPLFCKPRFLIKAFLPHSMLFINTWLQLFIPSGLRSQSSGCSSQWTQQTRIPCSELGAMMAPHDGLREFFIVILFINSLVSTELVTINVSFLRLLPVYKLVVHICYCWYSCWDALSIYVWCSCRL